MKVKSGSTSTTADEGFMIGRCDLIHIYSFSILMPFIFNMISATSPTRFQGERGAAREHTFEQFSFGRTLQNYGPPVSGIFQLQILWTKKYGLIR